MTDDERTAKIEELQGRLAALTAYSAALESEMKELAANIDVIREEHGNPFFYSGIRHGRPENADKSIAKFSGHAAHERGLTPVFSFIDVGRELAALRDELRQLGVSVE
jgi:hypothetical protein